MAWRRVSGVEDAAKPVSFNIAEVRMARARNWGTSARSPSIIAKCLRFRLGEYETSLHGGRRDEGVKRAETVRFRGTPEKIIRTQTYCSIDVFDRAGCYERMSGMC